MDLFMKIKILIFALLLPFFVDGQISVAKRLLLSQGVPPTYLSGYASENLSNCPYSDGSILGFFTISVDLVTMSDTYSGSTADCIQITAITPDYDGDGYGGYSIVTDNWGGSTVSLPITRNLTNDIADPFLGIQYTVSSSSDICNKIDVDNADEVRITYRIKGENGLWGPSRVFTGAIYN